MATLVPTGNDNTGNAGQGSGAVANQNRTRRGIFANDIPKSINPIDPSNSTPIVGTGLAKGGKLAGQNSLGGTDNIQFADKDKDWRVRVGVHPSSGVLYRGTDPGILGPLLNSDGVIFPFVPSITVNYQAKYGSRSLTHTNYTNYFYEASEIQNIQIVGDFSVQNTVDADYFLAVIYFFRAASKMFYGNSGAYQGSPPPILYLNGYGQHYFPNVPCVLTYFNHQLPNDVDYIETNTLTGLPPDSNQERNSAPIGSRVKNVRNRVPTNSTITLQLQPVYSRQRQTEFDHQKFARGDQINKGFL
jgi:hypothetical protein